MAGLKVIMAAGGTGGHLGPALSLARAIEQVAEAEFVFVGTGRPIEDKMLGPAGYRRRILKVSGLKGQGALGGLKALVRCLASVSEARALIRDFRPDLCFGAGGYVTVPVGLAAKLSGVPLVIHEQNSRPGLSNKVLGRLAAKVLLGFEEAAPAFPAEKSLFTGNPVRPEIAALSRRSRAPHQPPVIAVTGGSQGASGLNRLVVPALIELKRAGLEFQVFHQSGLSDRPWVAEAYEEAGLAAEVLDFCQDMPAFYAGADLIVSRAGALTIAELTAAGLPSILIPLPTAADDHQSLNARLLESGGAALVLAERGSEPAELAGALTKLLGDRALLEKMARASAALARPEAAADMARVCLQTIGRA